MTKKTFDKIMELAREIEDLCPECDLSSLYMSVSLPEKESPPDNVVYLASQRRT